MRAKEAYQEAGKMDEHHKKMFEMMEMALGANTDIVSGGFTEDNLGRSVIENFENIWENESWMNYIESRFGSDRPSNAELKEFWFHIYTEKLPV